MSESTVILGAGIIGVSTAYYLSQSLPGESIHLVESSPELFASASGKAGGFLAADWFGPSSAPLGLLSFKLHKELADQFNGKEKWGFSFSTGTSFTESTEPIISGEKKERDGDWLGQGSSRAEVAGQHEFHNGTGPAWLTRRRGDSLEIVGADDTVAQVDPLRLSQFLLAECKARGVHLHQPASATSLITDTKKALVGIRISYSNDGREIELPCENLVLASGAWTPQVHRTLFPSSPYHLPISSLAGHSITITSPHWTPSHEPKGCHAVFASSDTGISPEIFSRIGGEIYIAGLNDSNIPLPSLPTDSVIEEEAIGELVDIAERLCGIEGEEVLVVRKGLCFRPVTPWGRPIVARLGKREVGGGVGGNVFVAAGHGPWGISLSLGTGLVVSEMVRGVKSSCRVGGLGLK